MAFNTAITGLKASTNELDVTGNNIANASTVGFKAGRTEFSDIFTTVVVGAGATNNPGAGVTVSDIAQDFTAGTIEFTNNNLDLAIDGSGFFQLRDSQGGVTYTRAGGFELDKDGNVVTKNGKFLQGFGLDELGNQLPVGNLAVSQKESEPQSTTQVDLSFNIDSRDEAEALLRPYNPDDAKTYTFSNSSRIFDSLGNQHTLKLDMVEMAPRFERQEYTFTGDPSPAGTVPDVSLSIAGLPIGPFSVPYTAGDVASAAKAALDAAKSDPSIDFDSRIKSVSVVGNALVVDYFASAGEVDELDVLVTGGTYPDPTVRSFDGENAINAREQQAIDLLPADPSIAPNSTISFGGVDITIQPGDTGDDIALAIAREENAIIERNPDIESVSVDPNNDQRIVVTYKPELGDQPELAIDDSSLAVGVYSQPDAGVASNPSALAELEAGDNSYQGVYQLYAYLDGEELLDIGADIPFVNGDGTEPGPIPIEFDTTTGALLRVNGQNVGSDGQAPLISILGADPTIPESEQRRTSSDNNPRNDLQLDLTGTTQFASESIVKASSQNGFTKGDLIGVSFAEDGTMVASFSNGQNTNLGIVALATFENQGGLQPTGNTEWSATLDSGQAILNPPGSGLNGALRSSALEQSNVDLSEELVALIEAQRNFQANSKTLQTENSVTQTILQIQ
ncbi:flagellar hook-basal body complex protein [Motiliproteus sp. SC1-56]|uniref:flagellar hook-basal body complex protein n=1 Tax=Motiliproteus sp. SC1-56 TaxID=2799565 RepID=UPI001A8F715A|nr:flagellar hook-basal body complex protein [Motiliproteus sp. SC1-56]